jgi:hypothetical protein
VSASPAVKRGAEVLLLEDQVESQLLTMAEELESTWGLALTGVLKGLELA